MDSEYRILLVHDTRKLVAHRERILGLFTISFGIPLDPAIWTWAYCNNPCGPAYVYLAYSGEELVAHYAMIPLYYIGAGIRVRVALSMTTMVHPSHRKSGLFRELAEMSYRQGAADGVSAVVGFPNKASEPGFRKRLSWEIDQQLGIVALAVESSTTAAILAVNSISEADFSAAFRAPAGAVFLDLSDPIILSWRVSKPGVQYRLLQTDEAIFIVKPFGIVLDVVYHSRLDTRDLEMLGAYASTNGFSTLSVFRAVDEKSSQATPYRFGFRYFLAGMPPFEPQLILSDVF